MADYLHLFNSVTDFTESYNGNDYHEPWVSLILSENRVDYNKVPLQPLTFSILSDGNIGWKAYNSSSVRTIQYSKNGGEWTDITSTTEGVTIPVVTGDVLKFKGDTWPGSEYNNYSKFTSTCTFAASGNPGSLKYGEETYGDEALAASCYYGLFEGCKFMNSAPELPATTLVSDCYFHMFYGCTSLTTAPELPATTLANQCYREMFYGCTSLTTAPELPATTLAGLCYECMFENCTSLTTAPELPATTNLPNGCYFRMFGGCTSLISPPELPATTFNTNQYQVSQYYQMFKGCTGLTTAPDLPVTTLTQNCYYGMFENCTSLTTAPELPATTLKNNCYSRMFSGCTNLNYIKCLATDISATDCTSNWVNGVAGTGTFVKPASTDWSSKTGNDGIPSGWTVQGA